jgi:hypothetical protein
MPVRRGVGRWRPSSATAQRIWAGLAMASGLSCAGCFDGGGDSASDGASFGFGDVASAPGSSSFPVADDGSAFTLERRAALAGEPLFGVGWEQVSLRQWMVRDPQVELQVNADGTVQLVKPVTGDLPATGESLPGLAVALFDEQGQWLWERHYLCQGSLAPPSVIFGEEGTLIAGSFSGVMNFGVGVELKSTRNTANPDHLAALGLSAAQAGARSTDVYVVRQRADGSVGFVDQLAGMGAQELVSLATGRGDQDAVLGVKFGARLDVGGQILSSSTAGTAGAVAVAVLSSAGARLLGQVPSPRTLLVLPSPVAGALITVDEMQEDTAGLQLSLVHWDEAGDSHHQRLSDHWPDGAGLSATVDVDDNIYLVVQASADLDLAGVEVAQGAAALIKLDPEGTPLWQRLLGSDVRRARVAVSEGRIGVLVEFNGLLSLEGEAFPVSDFADLALLEWGPAGELVGGMALGSKNAEDSLLALQPHPLGGWLLKLNLGADVEEPLRNSLPLRAGVSYLHLAAQ